MEGLYPVSAPEKPLGRKAYGSIGHIHGSRLGPGDHHVHEGQSAYCTTKAPKDKKVWVQTKLDGSCVSAALLDTGELVALGRAGYLARTSNYAMHHMWADWVDRYAEDFRHVLQPGERIVGEWLAQAHGTRYELNGRDPFVAFDIFHAEKRLPFKTFRDRTFDRFVLPDTMIGPSDPVEAMNRLYAYGADQPEGVVYRVESAKGVDFLAKWVRPDKVDGGLLDQNIWNWLPAGVAQPAERSACNREAAGSIPAPGSLRAVSSSPDSPTADLAADASPSSG